MLNLNNINKTYKIGDEQVDALKDITLRFRRSEFVSVLGPSGCGKTTLLNIIGGLDKYTDGELCINNKSTKSFNGTDWDAYRNRNIGFIFQGYNLIPHLNILKNVELSLTVAGISKKERTKRAKEILRKVGLKDKYNKKPNQLSGGQQQRVAIARALVNNPDIILADEPTGALDTNTSLAIMKLIKEIAKDRLVIMVTHNPKLASDYSTRIIRLKDGLIEEDSDPYQEEEIISVDNDKNKIKMSWLTSIRLSLSNLLSKKRRTILMVMAGTIGILGISIVLSLRNGVNNFIQILQKEFLEDNPISIREETINVDEVLSSIKPDFFNRTNNIDFSNRSVSINELMQELIGLFNNTDTTHHNKIDKYFMSFLNQIPVEYNARIDLDENLPRLDFNIFTYFKTGDEELFTALYIINYTHNHVMHLLYYLNRNHYEFEFMDSHEHRLRINEFSTILMPRIFEEMSNSRYEVMNQNYEIYGRLPNPNDKTEMLLVINSNAEISSQKLATLGIMPHQEFDERFVDFLWNDEKTPYLKLGDEIKYTDIVGRNFVWLPNDAIFEKNSHIDPSQPFLHNSVLDKNTEAILDKFNECKVEITIVGVAIPNEDTRRNRQSILYYSPLLMEHVIRVNKQSEIINYMICNEINEFRRSRNLTGTTQGQVIPRRTVSRLNTDLQISDEVIISAWRRNRDHWDSYLFCTHQNASWSLSRTSLGMPNEFPSRIRINADNFANRINILNHLDRWNSDEIIRIYLDDGMYVDLTPEDRQKIIYMDSVILAGQILNTMINGIVLGISSLMSLSLIVSALMVGIFTYASVIERTKEIGIVRSIGGRKKDVIRIFNAETFILGLSAGLIGISTTLLLSLVINVFAYQIIETYLLIVTPSIIIIMILLSIIINIIAGIIPAIIASKKEPANSLRT